MTNVLPPQISLTPIANGDLFDASVLEGNNRAVQVATNGVIAALSNGGSGQLLKSLGENNLEWGNEFADKASATEQDFTAPVLAPNFQVGVLSPGTDDSITPNVTDNGVLVATLLGSIATVNNPIGFPPPGKSALFSIILTQATNILLTWGSAYRFGSWSNSVPGVGNSYAWTFLMVGDLSRAICIGTSNGAFT